MSHAMGGGSRVEVFSTRIRSVRDKRTGHVIRVLKTEGNPEFKKRIASVTKGMDMQGWFFVCWEKDLMPTYSYRMDPFESVLDLSRHIDRCMGLIINDRVSLQDTESPVGP